MLSSRFSISCFLVFFVVVVQTSYAFDPIFHTCSSSENFTAYSPYEANLNTIMSYLYLQVPISGFANASLGGLGFYQIPNQQAYGIGLCKANVSTSDCKSCIAQASYEIRQRCQYNKRGVIWYDYCQLKYSDVDFIGTIDDSTKFILYNVNNASDPLRFNEVVRNLMTNLTQQASFSAKMYSDGEALFGGAEKVYGLAQCTRDLSSGDCEKCLTGLIDEIPRCCDAKQGGRIVTGSCNIRYEMYPFLNA